MTQINSHKNQPPVQRNMKLAGGWYEAKLNDPDVLEAAAFCLHSLQTLALDSDQNKPDYSFTVTPELPNTQTSLTVKVIQATKQVVAGMNYALTIMLLEGNTCVGVFKATVYNRFGELSITNWSEEITCTEGALLMETDNRYQNGDSD